ncbi:3-hydroxyisobutyryl-CoA hydrolase mitochondrial precursor [Eremomyces bilateralis CBS 781.70]|uniref:3-hydroxyisobutyryl-CoA hydrolase n=1 Tax=Eremomyces bilateralis CBS 781.70 TaxID=1392243 RepID=A0A6G1GCG6_9PEZI|nr:3-hydroxyisobutyryl-CoA hydrolase mitochondrial precursor [Eremomyces bilateralis CBS 781.70]KAF1815590.1 3-hydroxyisobutyryl-CoA hydrolase mitochondrial precursor [Eremomyces bilateralis CBS 781.70]
MSSRSSLLRIAVPVLRCSYRPAFNMPLRAKVQSSAMPQTRRYASMQELIKEQPNDDLEDVVFTNQYGLRLIELNRPKKLNSLDGSMARKIIPRLREWEKSSMANVVLIKGAGRAFCAGGDVAALAKWNKEGPAGQQRSKDYFAVEYGLDHMIATYGKPYIAFMDGITMGGGVGLSIHAPFRIATENTVFAMPETTIGFFPEVGASFFLPKMDGNLGTYLALTSEQLKGVDVFYHGVATHFMHSTSLPELESRLAELQFKDYTSLQERYQIINATIEEFNTGLPSPRPSITGQQRLIIDTVFNPNHKISSVLSGLEAITNDSNSSEAIKKWAARTTATINERSPTSVAVTLEQMRVARTWDIATAFRMEHAIAGVFMAHPDFVEGVSARLIERKKTRPDWKPNTLPEVSEQQVQKFFNAEPELELLVNRKESSFVEYPHKDIGLPQEKDIRQVAKEGRYMGEEIVQHFLEKKKHKQGVREKVEEVLERIALEQ